MSAEIFDHEDRRKFQFWNTSPPDVLRDAKTQGRAHFSRATKGILFHQSFFPVGQQHREKTMERVPADYLLWAVSQPFASRDRDWQRVADYVDRHRAEIEERALKEAQACKKQQGDE
jgi:hypothetical protein